MTKKEAIAKIVKLRRLAEGTNSTPEANNARAAIRKIAADHKLSETDLMQGVKAEAFDELVSQLDTVVRKHRNEVPSTVFEVFEKIKSDVTEENKADLLVKIVSSVRIGGMIFGFNETFVKIKDTVTEVLKKYDLHI